MNGPGMNATPLCAFPDIRNFSISLWNYFGVLEFRLGLLANSSRGHGMEGLPSTCQGSPFILVSDTGLGFQ